VHSGGNHQEGRAGFGHTGRRCWEEICVGAQGGEASCEASGRGRDTVRVLEGAEQWWEPLLHYWEHSCAGSQVVEEADFRHGEGNVGQHNVVYWGREVGQHNALGAHSGGRVGMHKVMGATKWVVGAALGLG
jgi:hypothetical protein